MIRPARISQWALNAQKVSVVGDFNEWNNLTHPLRPRDQSGVWEGYIPGTGDGQINFPFIPFCVIII